MIYIFFYIYAAVLNKIFFFFSEEVLFWCGRGLLPGSPYQEWKGLYWRTQNGTAGINTTANEPPRIEECTRCILIRLEVATWLGRSEPSPVCTMC